MMSLVSPGPFPASPARGAPWLAAAGALALHALLWWAVRGGTAPPPPPVPLLQVELLPTPAPTVAALRARPHLAPARRS